MPILFDTATVAILSDETTALFSTRELDHNQHIQFGGAATEEFLEGNPGLSEALTHPLIWTLALHALGRDPYLAYLRAYRIDPIQPKSYRAFQPHIDGHGFEIKAMILLSDVPPGGQGMRYWRSSHLIPWNVYSSRDTIFTNEQVDQFGPPVECNGKAGSVFLFNTNGIHSGTRNTSKRRDVMVLTITSGNNLYKIPMLDYQVREKVANNLYLRNILRLDAEKQLGEIGPAPAEIAAYRSMYISTCSNKIKYDARRTLRSHQEMFGPPLNHEASKTTRLHSLSFQSRPQPPKRVHDIPSLRLPPDLERLETVIAEDIARGIDLPIRLSSGVRDPLRDTALCEIRDGWLHAQITRKLFAKILLTAASNASTLPNRQCYAKAVCHAASWIDKMDKEAGPKHITYRAFLEDMVYCTERSETLPLLRTILLFVLGALEQIKQYGRASSENRGVVEIDEIFATLAYDYVALASKADQRELGTIDFMEVLTNEK